MADQTEALVLAVSILKSYRTYPKSNVVWTSNRRLFYFTFGISGLFPSDFEWSLHPIEYDFFFSLDFGFLDLGSDNFSLVSTASNKLLCLFMYSSPVFEVRETGFWLDSFSLKYWLSKLFDFHGCKTFFEIFQRFFAKKIISNYLVRKCQPVRITALRTTPLRPTLAQFGSEFGHRRYHHMVKPIAFEVFFHRYSY